MITLQKHPRSGMVIWPDNWADRHFNCNEPCDVLVGACSCGAWHCENENWVQAVLAAHNAKIEETPVTLFCPKCHFQLSIPVKFDGKGLSCGFCYWLGNAIEALKELPSRIKMQYVSIDLETTGLDPARCQILEVGAIYDDGIRYVDDLPIFHKYI